MYNKSEVWWVFCFEKHRSIFKAYSEAVPILLGFSMYQCKELAEWAGPPDLLQDLCQRTVRYHPLPQQVSHTPTSNTLLYFSFKVVSLQNVEFKEQSLNLDIKWQMIFKPCRFFSYFVKWNDWQKNSLIIKMYYALIKIKWNQMLDNRIHAYRLIFFFPMPYCWADGNVFFN